MFKSISIIYPVFNEEKRLGKVFSDIKKFERLTNYIEKEYIFVDDGSSDNSLSLIKKKAKENKKFKFITYKKNMGKGYALKKGVKIAKKKWVLTSDADCSVSNLQLINWRKKKFITKEHTIYFGSRNHLLSKVKKKIERKILGIIFKLIINFFFNIKISDTQCGFKLYNSKIAKKLFRKIQTNGYLHDIEICLIARKLNIRIIDLPLNWKHRNYGKINFFNDFFKIFFHLIKIRLSKY